MSAPNSPLDEARRRIADCFHGRDEQGRLIQRRDALNLAGLGLTAEEIEERFDGDVYADSERGLGEIGFEDLIHLRYLDLTSNKLERLPRGTRGFGQLRWLGLNFNKLASIASEAGDWKDLQRLYLRKNQLRTLPESVATWTKLEEVDLAENKGLTSLPPAWLEALTQRRSDGSEAPEIVIELEGSGLANAFEKEKGTKLTRDNFHEAAVQAWLRTVKHRPENVLRDFPSLLRMKSKGDVTTKSAEEVPVIVTDYEIIKRIREWGEEATANAIASLAFRDRDWLSVVEVPSKVGMALSEPADLGEIDAEVRRMKRADQAPAFVHPLWRAWYATGLKAWISDWNRRIEGVKKSVIAEADHGEDHLQSVPEESPASLNSAQLTSARPPRLAANAAARRGRGRKAS